MESRGFLTRLFGLNSASASSKNSATVHSDKVQQHDLKQPESAAEGEDRKREGQAQEEKHDRTAVGDEVEMEKRNGDSDGSEKEDDDKEDERRGVGWKSEFPFPLRPDAEDCAFYLKTGTCKFGSNCKFNHPIQRKQQAAKEKDQEESKEKTGQFECKYYLTPEGCKYGKACRYNHSKANSVAPDIELNFLGLPIRPGEIDCPFYMRTGTCKFSGNCKFNHPDPTSGADPPVEHSDRGSAALQSASEFPVCSPSGAFNNKFPPYVPVIYSPIQVVSPPNAGWNGYPFPLKPQPLVRNMHPPPVYVINSPTTADSHIHRNHQQQMGVEEFPERPGQPECSYFLKTGDCKFKSNCKYHHPKERFLKSPPLALSEEGLPLRPNQEICSYYSRYGICKFGPACKFDHSVHLAKPGLRSQSSMENFLVEEDPLMRRSRIAGDPFVVQQQPLQEVQISAFFGC